MAKKRNPTPDFGAKYGIQLHILAPMEIASSSVPELFAYKWTPDQVRGVEGGGPRIKSGESKEVDLGSSPGSQRWWTPERANLTLDIPENTKPSHLDVPENAKPPHLDVPESA